MYMTLDDLRKKFASDQPFAIQFVKDAAAVQINVNILDASGQKVDVEFNDKGEIVGGKLYDDVNLLQTYNKVISAIIKDKTTQGQKRLYDYMHAPFDEPDFEIDTNTRVITVPPAFNKNGVGVVGDHLAEILFFKVPRFFDITDLFSTEISIYWNNSNVKGTEKKYYKSPIADMKYVVDNNLYFMWYISELVSSNAGTIEFFVEFENIMPNGQVNFRLETQSAKITIKPTLTFDKEEVEEDSYRDIIYSRSIYSPIINSLTAAPAIITQNLIETTTNLNADGYIELHIDAQSPDNGDLYYYWNWNGIPVTGDNNDNNINSNNMYQLIENKNIEFNDETDTNTYKTLTTNVPGTYQVYVGNKNNDNNGIRYVYSNATRIEPANQIVINSINMPGMAYIDGKFNISPVLKVSVENANKGNEENITYQWYHNDRPIDNANTDTYDPNSDYIRTDYDARGSYYCIATNKLNNTRTDVKSEETQIEVVPSRMQDDQITIEQSSNILFTVTISNLPFPEIEYEMYANISPEIIDKDGQRKKVSIKINNSEQLIQEGFATFSIDNVTDLSNNQLYDIDVYVVPVVNFGTQYVRYAEEERDGKFVKAYAHAGLDNLRYTI